MINRGGHSSCCQVPRVAANPPAPCDGRDYNRIPAGILCSAIRPDTAAAAQSLQTAIATAHHQKARSFELRAALSLAKLYRAANRDADAHAVLARHGRREQGASD
jgi:hypothetical protein